MAGSWQMLSSWRDMGVFTTQICQRQEDENDDLIDD
jgi:hypothetical protein